jgi:hypothetical protein
MSDPTTSAGKTWRVASNSRRLSVYLLRCATEASNSADWPDPANTVCRQTATKVNWTELLLVPCNGLGGGRRPAMGRELLENLISIEPK